MLIFQFNQEDTRNVKLLDYEIPDYLTNVIDEYNHHLNRCFRCGVVSYEFIAQELIIMYIRRAIKQGHINHNDVVVIGTTSSGKHFQFGFDLNAKCIGNVPIELQQWTNIALELI
jgi:hypothetical protein